MATLQASLWGAVRAGDNLGWLLQCCQFTRRENEIESPYLRAFVQRWERRTRKDRIDEVLHMVHMAPHADKYPSQLSGGEQQRVAIARALVARSQLLLLDEPLSNLDSDLKSALLEEFSVLQRRLNLTTLYITHDKLEAATFADTVVKMKNGRIDESNLTLMQGVR